MQGGNGIRQREEGHIRHAEGEMEIKRQERGGEADTQDFPGRRESRTRMTRRREGD